MNQLLYILKECSECGNIKPLTEFHKDSRRKDGVRSRCKVCRISENNSYYRDRTKKYKNFNQKKLKRMKKEQEHKCLIYSKRTELVIDHSHSHKGVRGLLCNKCNLGLGHFLDSPKRLLKALIYIIKKEYYKIFSKKVKNNSDFIFYFGKNFLSL